MCVICWKEFSEQNPAYNLGCGHFGCAACRAGVSRCPVCNSAVAQGSTAADTRKRDSAAVHKQQHHHYSHHHHQPHQQQQQQPLQLLGSPHGRRARAYHEHITAFVTAAGAAAGARALTATPSEAERAFDDLATSDDHFAPLAALGLADAATPPRLRMLERTPSGSADSGPGSRAGSAGGGGGAGGGGRGAAAKRAVAVSARHIAHGSYVAGRALLVHALLPAARASCAASRAVAAATCVAAVATGRAVAGAAGGAVRFASAPRVRVVGFDGEQAATGAGGALAHGGAASPEPISNLEGGRIRLAGCRATRLRVEYCRDCVLVATGLQDCELLLVGCSRLRLVLRGCSGLVLRELQCSDMGDCVRRRCERFSHEIVCLRCACKPMSSGGGGGGWGLGGGGGAGLGQSQQLHPSQRQQQKCSHPQQQQQLLLPAFPQLQHQQQQFQQLLHRYNSVSSSTSSSAVFQGNGNWH